MNIKKLIPSILLLSFLLCIYSCNYSVEPYSSNLIWFKTFGGGNEDFGYNVQQTSDGGYIIVGRTDLDNSFNWDIYLVRANTEGKQIWEKKFGHGIADETGYFVQQTYDNGFIISGKKSYYEGPYKEAIYVIKTNSNGNKQWEKLFGDFNQFNSIYNSKVMQTYDGGFLIGGTTLNGIYLYKIDMKGNKEWDCLKNNGYSYQLTRDGGFVIVGSIELSSDSNKCDVILIKTNSNGDEIWTKTYGGLGKDLSKCVIQANDGGYIIAGNKTLPNSRFGHVFLIKTDSKGNQAWLIEYKDIADEVQCINQIFDGGYIIGTLYCSMIKADSKGNKIWYKNFNLGEIGNIQQTIDGGFIMTGSTVFGGPDPDLPRSDIFLLKIGGNT